MLLVELHHLFVELGAVVAVLGLQLAHLRRQPLHLEHALGALQRQRCGDHHDDDGDQGDRCGVAVGQAVEPGEQPRGQVEHSGSDHRRSVLVSTVGGTAAAARGRSPDGPNGRQRSSRRSVSQRPPPATVDEVGLAGVRRARRREPTRRRAAGAGLPGTSRSAERPASPGSSSRRRGDGGRQQRRHFAAQRCERVFVCGGFGPDEQPPVVAVRCPGRSPRRWHGVGGAAGCVASPSRPSGRPRRRRATAPPRDR